MKTRFNKDQLMSYWAIVTNIILVLSTFWMGLVVQEFVAKKNANVSATLARVEYINNVKPCVDTLNVRYSSFIYDLYGELSNWNSSQNQVIMAGGTFVSFIPRLNTIVDYYGNLIETSKDVVYYLDNDGFESDVEVLSNLKSIKDVKPDNLNDYLKKLPLIVKVGALYSYREMMEFCFINDSTRDYQKKSLKDWPDLEKRLETLYRSPEYVRTVGLMVGYKDMIKTLKSEYDKLYQSQNDADNTMAQLAFIMKTFTVALDIHNQLNDNRTYKQPEYKLGKEIMKAPWSILIIGLLITWIIVTIFIHRTKNLQSNDDIIKKLEQKISIIEKSRKTSDTQIEDIKQFLHNEEKTIAIFQNTIEQIQGQIIKLENDLKNHTEEKNADDLSPN